MMKQLNGLIIQIINFIILYSYDKIIKLNPNFY